MTNDGLTTVVPWTRLPSQRLRYYARGDLVVHVPWARGAISTLDVDQPWHLGALGCVCWCTWRPAWAPNSAAPQQQHGVMLF